MGSVVSLIKPVVKFATKVLYVARFPTAATLDTLPSMFSPSFVQPDSIALPSKEACPFLTTLPSKSYFVNPTVDLYPVASTGVFLENSWTTKNGRVGEISTEANRPACRSNLSRRLNEPSIKDNRSTVVTGLTAPSLAVAGKSIETRSTVLGTEVNSMLALEAISLSNTILGTSRTEPDFVSQAFIQSCPCPPFPSRARFSSPSALTTVSVRPPM